MWFGRYKIGDTIKFTSLSPYRFQIFRRTKQYINTFGEEVIVDNAEQALAEGEKLTQVTYKRLYRWTCLF
jgi:DNA recombination-dependent growth factor C